MNKNNKFNKKFKNNNNNNNNNNDNENYEEQLYNKKYYNKHDMTVDDIFGLLNKTQQQRDIQEQILEEIYNHVPKYLNYAAKKVELEENLKMTQYKTRKNFYECNTNADSKNLKNDKWFQFPVSMSIEGKWYNIENYKVCGFKVYGETKKDVVNFHALLALERRSIEHFVLQKVLGYNEEVHQPIRSVTDVYCSTRLTAIYADNVRFHRPIVEARDIQRKRELEEKLLNKHDGDMTKMCDCKIDNKICEHMKTTDVLNFTHSMYYVKESLINDAIKEGKTITGVAHIFKPGDYEIDYVVGEDHLAHIKRNKNKIEMTIMNDKTYNHPAILNYLWERNEFSFSNCTVQVYSRIHHKTFQHIGFAIYPFKNIKPDLTTDFRLHTSEESDDNKFYKDGLKTILGQENEINFAQHYNSGKIGYLKVYDRDGNVQKDEKEKDKYLLIRKIEGDYVFPKLINTEWTTFKSISLMADKEQFIYVKEDLINSGLKSMVSGEDFDKAYNQLISKILTKVNTSNPDIIVTIAMNILKTAYNLKTKLQFVEHSNEYKGLKNQDYKNYEVESWLRPIDKLKDKIFNKQVKMKIDLNDDNFFTKRYVKVFKKKLLNTLKEASLYTKNYFSFEYINKFYNDKNLSNYKNNNLNLEIEKLPELAYQDYHKPKDIIIEKHDPKKLQKLKEKIRNKIYFVDNYVLKNVLSAWSLVNQHIVPPEHEYSLDVPINASLLFKRGDDVFDKADMYQNLWDKLGDNNNECLFIAMAMAMLPHEQATQVNYIKLAKNIKRDAYRAAFNSGWYLDVLSDGLKDVAYVQNLLEAWNVGLIIVDGEEYKKGNLKLIERVHHNKNNIGTIMLVKNGQHLDVLKKKVLKYGSKKLVDYQDSCLENGRIIYRNEHHCIDRKVFEENIVNLSCQNKDKFACPIFPEISAYTTYEEFTNKVPCTCKGPMTFGFQFDDDKRDQTVVYYDQCPRIQIIAALRQLIPQNPYDEVLYDKLNKFADKFLDDVNIDKLIKKHFTNIDYNRWLQRCKPKYRTKILRYLKKHEDWQKIKEPNIVNGMIKEEVQDEGDKARALGSPTILHKMLMGPLESCFENMFREMFPDFWGVGESTNQKEFELNEIAKRLNADKSITLDISGLDQSHNRCVKLFWRKVLNRVTEFLKNEPNNSVFSPDSIKEALDKNSTILIYFNKDYKRKKENKGDTDSDSQYTVVLEIMEKMASGQGYTTVLNTSLMCFLMEYIKYDFNMNVGGKISGDDVALVTSNSKEQWSKVLGYVFSKKGANNKGGVGLVLKYFRYGDLDAISPCSLLAFVCPKHGIRLVRQYHRYIKNFFYSQKMLKMPDFLRFDFFGTVCQGERYWAEGYKAFDIINKWPKPNEKTVRQIADFFASSTGKKHKFYNYDGEKITEEKFAQKLFKEKGVELSDDITYWDRYDNFLFREANWLRNETIDSFKKLPVYECCSDALTEKLREIDPLFLNLDIKDIMDQIASMDKYYDNLNCEVHYVSEQTNKYRLIKYEDALEEIPKEYYYRNRVYSSEFMMRKAIKKFYVEDMNYFRTKIRKFKNLFIA